MNYQILDDKRIAIIPRLSFLRERFFLAGGTGLALQIGHRISVDFDFFCLKDFDTAALFEELKNSFDGFELKKIQEEKNTLSALVDGVKLSFFKYPYPLADSLVEEKNLRVASIIDICLMKLSAIVSRATLKDYADLYFIFNSGKIDLNGALANLEKTIPSLDENLVLKSLVYFGDIQNEPVKFAGSGKIATEDIKFFFEKEILKLAKS